MAFDHDQSLVSIANELTTIQETLRCRICLDLLNCPSRLKCGHNFCTLCIQRAMDSSKSGSINCPLCASGRITKRSLNPNQKLSPLVDALKTLMAALNKDLGIDLDNVRLPQSNTREAAGDTPTTSKSKKPEQEKAKGRQNEESPQIKKSKGQNLAIPEPSSQVKRKVKGQNEEKKPEQSPQIKESKGQNLAIPGPSSHVKRKVKGQAAQNQEQSPQIEKSKGQAQNVDKAIQIQMKVKGQNEEKKPEQSPQIKESKEGDNSIPEPSSQIKKKVKGRNEEEKQDLLQVKKSSKGQAQKEEEKQFPQIKKSKGQAQNVAELQSPQSVEIIMTEETMCETSKKLSSKRFTFHQRGPTRPKNTSLMRRRKIPFVQLGPLAAIYSDKPTELPSLAEVVAKKRRRRRSGDDSDDDDDENYVNIEPIIKENVVLEKERKKAKRMLVQEGDEEEKGEEMSTDLLTNISSSSPLSKGKKSKKRMLIVQEEEDEEMSTDLLNNITSSSQNTDFCPLPDVDQDPAAVDDDDHEVHTQVTESVLGDDDSDADMFDSTPLKRTSRSQPLKVSCEENNSFLNRNECKKMVLISSGLQSEERDLFKAFVSRFCMKTRQKVDECVTHVVVRHDSLYNADRTLKFLTAVTAGKWIVGFQWVRDCLDKGKVGRPEKYEVKDNNGEDGPRQARLAMTSSSVRKLMANIEICLSGNFDVMSRDDLVHILLSAGGSVSRSVHSMSFRGQSLIVVDSTPQVTPRDAAEHLRTFKSTNVAVVSRDWVIDSISAYRLMPILDYLRHDASPIQLADAGYEGSLL